MMKRKLFIISLLPLVVLVLMLVIWSCFKSNTRKTNAFSERDKSQTLAVLTREALQSYQVKGEKIVGNGSLPIKTADVINDSLLIDDTLLFSTGHGTSSAKDFYIYTLDLTNGNLLKYKRQAFPTTGEVKDSQHFYTLTSESKTTVQQFSKAGKFLKEAVIDAPSVGTQVFEYGNETFVMAGTEDLVYDETYYRGRLYIFDTKTLAYKRYVDLEADDDPYRKNYSSMQVINGVGYCFSDVKRMRHDTTPMEPDNTVLTYEFATGEMQETYLSGTPARCLSKSSNNEYLIYVLADEETKSSLRIVNMVTKDEFIIPADELIGKSSQIDVLNNQYVVVAGKNHLGLYDLLTGTFLDETRLTEKEREADMLVKLNYLSK